MSHPTVIIPSRVVGADPTARYTQRGTKVASISLLTVDRRKKKDSDEWENDEQWNFVRAYGNLADTFIRNIKKGDRNLVVECVLQHRKGQDGKYHTNLVVQKILEWPVSGDRLKSLEEMGITPPPTEPEPNPDLDDEIPY